MPHRILHVVSSLDRYSAAADLLALATCLPADEFASRVVMLGRTGPLAEQFAKAGIELVRIDRRWRLDPMTLARLAGELRAAKPAVVHTWDHDARRYVSMAGERSTRGPWLSQWSGDRRGRVLTERLGRLPDRWVVQSDRQMQQLTKAKPEVPILVVPPGVPTANEPTRPRSEVLGKLQVPDGARLIGTAGPLVPTMGIKELIWAADMIRVLHPKVRLLIAGTGHERSHLELFARTAAEPENIVMLGDYDDWPAVLPHLDVYWQGTEPGATSPPTLLEAMAAGVPVVASRTPQHGGWIESGKTGWLVDYDARADRTRLSDRLFGDAELRRTIGQAARQHVAERFALTQRAEKFAAAYRSLLAETANQASASGPAPQ